MSLRLALPVTRRTKRIRWFLLVMMLASFAGIVRAHPPSPEVLKLFPQELGSFRNEQLSVRPLVSLARQGIPQPDYFAPNINPASSSPFIGGEGEYLSASGDKLLVEILQTQSDSTTYSLFNLVAKKEREIAETRLGDVGTASFVGAKSVLFFKGTTLARITNESSNSLEPALALASLFAATFDKGEGEIPVLVKHLPNWETARVTALYAVNLGALRNSISNQPILNDVNFDGGTEAVTANYGQSQLVIVEFTTPQFASDNDRRIVAKIQELKNQGQPVPSAYRRVGNYSVLVFNAPDEKTASALIDQVKYEQVVQWLGEDPRLYERIQKYFLQKTGGVVIAVLESSGLSVLLCLGIGGLFGALLFRRRRAQQRRAEAYSDAGGMVRLNLDEMTEETARHLIESSRKRD